MRKHFKKEKSQVVLFATLLSFILVIFTGCLSNTDTGETGNQGGKDTLVLADAQWDSIQFHNAVAQFIIEEGFGYDTEITSGSSAATFTGLVNGDIDIYMEAWVQNIKRIYDEAIDNEDVLEVATNFDDNRQGLYVPTYVIEGDSERGIEPMAPDLKTIKDLEKYTEVFQDEEDPSKGRIYGSPPGWEVDNILRTKVETYGLDEHYNYFSPGSSSGLAVSLGTSYENGDPWVGYYWEPEWVMAKYDLTLLEDEPFDEELWGEEAGYACEWPSVDVTIAVHKDMPEKAPEIVEFLSNYKTGKDLNNNILAYMQDNDASAEEAAKYFLQEYDELWISWVSEDIAEKVKAAL
jgi:glycine betaine/proline transport system substrate-binding protein